MKNILIIYGKSHSEVFNRKSALGSYIHCLANLLEDQNNTLFINGIRLNNQIETDRSSVTEPSTGILKKIVKKIIPEKLKCFLKERQVFGNLKNVENMISTSGARFDHIIEFYTFGSTLGLKTSEHHKCSYTLIYDGPIIEEYQFFNDSMPYHRKTVSQNESDSLKSASQIVVYSEPMKSYVVKRGANQNNTSIHQNIDFTRFDKSSDKSFESGKINICFIGSFLKWHQVEFLIHSSEKLKASGHDHHLYLVGDGQECQRMKELVSNRNLSDLITFTGFLDGHELFELKKKMHIGVMPGSNWYGAPNKIFEYGAMKMAVIAPDTPTISNLFNSEELQFFKWKDEDSFYEKFLEMIKSKSYLKLAEKLNDKIEKDFSQEKTRDFYMNFIGQ